MLYIYIHIGLSTGAIVHIKFKIPPHKVICAALAARLGAVTANDLATIICIHETERLSAAEFAELVVSSAAVAVVRLKPAERNKFIIELPQVVDLCIPGDMKDKFAGFLVTCKSIVAKATRDEFKLLEMPPSIDLEESLPVGLLTKDEGVAFRSCFDPLAGLLCTALDVLTALDRAETKLGAKKPASGAILHGKLYKIAESMFAKHPEFQASLLKFL